MLEMFDLTGKVAVVTGGNRGIGLGIARGFAKAGAAMWRSLLAVNFDGAFLTLRDAARHMKERGGGGKLIAISSITASFGAPKQAHYAAGKAALGGLVRSLAVELARYDIQVNGIQPGWISTEATAPAQRYKPLNEVIIKRTPARRWGTVEDLEGVAVYLASSASDFHTGDSLRVDGGYSVF